MPGGMWEAAGWVSRDRAVKATTANGADKRRATNTPAPSFVLITAKYNRENIFARSTGLAFELKGLNDGTDDDGVCREWMFEDYGGHAGAKHSRPVLAPEDAHSFSRLLPSHSA